METIEKRTGWNSPRNKCGRCPHLAGQRHLPITIIGYQIVYPMSSDNSLFIYTAYCLDLLDVITVKPLEINPKH